MSTVSPHSPQVRNAALTHQDGLNDPIAVPGSRRASCRNLLATGHGNMAVETGVLTDSPTTWQPIVRCCTRCDQICPPDDLAPIAQAFDFMETPTATQDLSIGVWPAFSLHSTLSVGCSFTTLVSPVGHFSVESCLPTIHRAPRIELDFHMAIPTHKTYTFRIHQEQIQTTFLDDDFVDYIRRAFAPSAKYIRDKKVWRFSKPQETASQSMVGKLGFEQPGQRQVIEYNEETQDFESRDEDTSTSSYVHYALHLYTKCIVVETLPRGIRRATVQRVLEYFLNRLNPYQEFKLIPITKLEEFDLWLRHTQKIKRVHLKMTRPNPNWNAWPSELRRWLDGPNADQTTITMSGQNINVEVVRDSITFLTSRDDLIRVTGDDGRVFDSKNRELSHNIEVPSDGSSDAIFTQLLGILRDLEY